MREHVNQFRLSLEENACAVFYLNYPAGNLKFSRNLNEKFVPFGRSYQDITDVLRSVSIAKTVFLTFPMPSPFIGEVSCSMEIFVLTSLGRKLLRSCVANVQTLNPKS